MKKTLLYSSILAFGLSALAAVTVQAQPDQQYDRQEARRYRQRDLMALQDDLRLVDEGLSAVPRRNRRYQEFEGRAEGIRQEVTSLVNDMSRRGPNRPGEGQVEIAALRMKISSLRNDIEDAQSRRGRGNTAFVIPAGTEIQVMLDQDLSSRSSNPEDRVQASTVTAIRVNGRTVIAAGATVSGFVREVRSRNRGQQDGWLRLDFDSLTPENGSPIRIRSHIVSVSALRSDDDKVRNTGLGALLGGVIGAMIDGKKGALIGAAVGAGGGLLASQGQDDVDLAEGTLITLRLDGPMTYARR